MTFVQQVPNKSAARIPNGNGPFIIGEHTLGKNNEGLTNTNSFDASPQLIAYPVPNDGNFFIENKNDQDKSIVLLDGIGRVIKSVTIKPYERINIEGLKSGIYFIKSEENIIKLAIF